MQHLHNRTEKQLSSAVACEPGNYGKGAWVNQAYSGSPPPVKRNINTVYNPQPMFHSSLENMNHMNMPNPYSAGDKVHTAKKSGCCSAFFKGLWGTAALTKDSKNNPEVMVKANLKELLVYIFFLLDLCLLTYGMTSSSAFYYTKAMTDLFVHYPGNGISFSSIGSMNDVWTYMEFNLLDSLYWNTYYNNVPFVNENQSLIYYENMLLGVPRIRQIKVKKNSCKVHEDFRREITECFDVYKEEKEDDSVFGSVNDTAWQYHTEKELKGSSHWGLLTTYSGSGFYQDLAKTKTESADIIAELKDNLWLDRGTRALFIDFSTYNANVNLFSVIRLVVEFPATGGAISSYQIRTVRLIRYVNTWDYFVMGCELVFCVFIFYYIMEEILEVRVNKVSHFKNIWNIVDLVVILLSLVAIIFSIFRTIKVDKLLSKILEQPNIYADFEFLAFWQTQYNNMNAVNLFFAWVKIFKYISFNKTMSQLTSTLSRCALDIFGFAIMFFIVFFAYAQLGYLLFGMEVETFSTFNKCIFTQFRIILGDFDYDAIDRANRVLGPIYFFSYVFFVFFVLLNMFLAIINDTYSEVKSELSSQKDEFQISDLIKQSYEKTIMKLKLKKEKISDVQKALDSGSSELTFQDFRDALKGMGHSDQEITDAFAKFDHDGNQTLDKLEQEKMKQELDEKRDSLNAELRNLGNGMSADDHGETKDFQRENVIWKNAYNQTVLGDILRNVGQQTVLGKRLTTIVISPTVVVNGGQELFGYKHSSKYLSLCSSEQRNLYRFGTTRKLAQKVTHLENAVALIMSKVNGIMEKMESRDKIDRHMNREDESRPASGGNIQVSLTRTQEQAPPTWSPAVPMGMLRNHLYPDGGWQAISENSSSARH